jgi:hypothetical protein
MKTRTKIASAALALAMAYAVPTAVVTSTVVGATAFNAATATQALAGKKRKIKRALRQIDKGNEASRNGDSRGAAKHYGKANKIMGRINNGVMAGPGCDRPGVVC